MMLTIEIYRLAREIQTNNKDMPWTVARVMAEDIVMSVDEELDDYPSEE